MLLANKSREHGAGVGHSPCRSFDPHTNHSKQSEDPVSVGTVVLAYGGPGVCLSLSSLLVQPRAAQKWWDWCSRDQLAT